MSDSGLDKLNRILDREVKNRALERRALRLGARTRQREYIELCDARLEASAERRQRLAGALASPELDAMRFRFYFSEIEKSIPLDELRRWIDGEIRRRSGDAA